MNSKLGTDIDYAVELLSKGLLVGIPTETVYGLAANAWNVAAVLNIFKAKNRPAFNPLILHADSIEKFESKLEILFDLFIQDLSSRKEFSEFKEDYFKI